MASKGYLTISCVMLQALSSLHTLSAERFQDGVELICSSLDSFQMCYVQQNGNLSRDTCVSAEWIWWFYFFGEICAQALASLLTPRKWTEQVYTTSQLATCPTFVSTSISMYYEHSEMRHTQGKCEVFLDRSTTLSRPLSSLHRQVLAQGRLPLVDCLHVWATQDSISNPQTSLLSRTLTSLLLLSLVTSEQFAITS